PGRFVIAVDKGTQRPGSAFAGSRQEPVDEERERSTGTTGRRHVTQELKGSAPSSSSRVTPANATGTPARSRIRPSSWMLKPGSRHTKRMISFQSAVTRP